MITRQLSIFIPACLFVLGISVTFSANAEFVPLGDRPYWGPSACDEKQRTCEVVEDFLAIDCTEEEVADKAGLFARQYFIDMEEQLILSPEIDVYEVDFDGHQFKATTDNICWQSFCISRADVVLFSTKSADGVQCKITTAEKLLSPFFDKIERAQRQNQF